MDLFSFCAIFITIIMCSTIFIPGLFELSLILITPPFLYLLIDTVIDCLRTAQRRKAERELLKKILKENQKEADDQ